MKLTKRHLLYAAIGLSLISLIYISSQYKPSSQPIQVDSTTPTPAPDQPLNLPPRPSIPVQFVNQSIVSNLPFSLPKYNIIDKELTAQQIQTFAQSLGFTTEAEPFEDTVYGQTFAWSQSNMYLQIRPRLRQIEFSTQSTQNTQPINQQITIATTNQFVNRVNQIFNTNLTISGIKFIKATTPHTYDEVESAKADSAVATLQAKVENYPIVGMSVVEVNPNIEVVNNQIISFGLYLPPSKTQVASQINILQSEELPNHYKDAFPLYISNTEEFGQFENPPIGSVNIANTSLYYYLDLKNNSLTPVYLLETTGKTKSNQPATTYFLLPAQK